MKYQNNPLNIRYNSINKWKKQINPKSGFCQFSSIYFGIRAGLVLLRKYRYSYGLDTPKKIISRWAPPSENLTLKYIEFVCSEVNSFLPFTDFLSSDRQIEFDFFDFTDESLLYRFVQAMCKIETNFQLDLETFQTALILVDPNIRPFSDTLYQKLLSNL